MANGISPSRRTSTIVSSAFVISGDKGNNNPEQFKGLMDPHIAVHGSFSVMVNYHSIGAYFTSRGGFALHNPQEEVGARRIVAHTGKWTNVHSFWCREIGRRRQL